MGFKRLWELLGHQASLHHTLTMVVQETHNLVTFCICHSQLHTFTLTCYTHSLQTICVAGMCAHTAMDAAKRYTKDQHLQREYGRFMILKRKLKDYDATILSPSLHVDTVWHAHILDTKRYSADCKSLCGRTIHHNPNGANDEAMQIERYNRTLSAYTTHFGEPAPLKYWPRQDENDEAIQVFVSELNTRLTTLRVKPSWNILTVKHVICSEGGPPVAQQRLLFAGKQLEDTATIASSHIQSFNTIHLVMRLTGC